MGLDIVILKCSMSRWFSTDPSFCPYCGTILPLPVDSGSVICKLCDYQQDASSERTYEMYFDNPWHPYTILSLLRMPSTAYEGMEEYSSIKFAVRKQKLAIADKSDGPMVSNTPPHPTHTSHIRPHHTHRWSVGA